MIFDIKCKSWIISLLETLDEKMLYKCLMIWKQRHNGPLKKGKMPMLCYNEITQNDPEISMKGTQKLSTVIDLNMTD